MCTSPLKINHPSFRLKKYCPKLFVPCGKCEECRNRVQNEIYVRLRSEYEYCRSVGGTAIMCDLTYSDDCVPKLRLPNGEQIFVFNKRDVILFIKRLRTRLDRQYKRNWCKPAPKFKYFVSSEFGSDENGTHRPHYHLIIFFYEPISITLFRRSYYASFVVDNQNGTYKRCFGYIYKLEEIKPEKGGIKYSAKYVCKDVAYQNTTKYIKDVIDGLRLKIDEKFGIIRFPADDIQHIRNRCVRSSKEYKAEVEKVLLPYRHMLQFYLISNDVGGSSFLDKYYQDIDSLPIVNYDGFNYPIPRYIHYLVERNYGYSAKLALKKNLYLKALADQLTALYYEGVICEDEREDLMCFARRFIQPENGCLRLVSHLSTPFESGDWESFQNEMLFYYDNSFYDMRQRLYDLQSVFNSHDRLMFRANLARNKLNKKLENDNKSMLNRFGFVKHKFINYG